MVNEQKLFFFISYKSVFPCFDSRNVATILIKVKSPEKASLGLGSEVCSIFSQGGIWTLARFYEPCFMAPDCFLVQSEGRLVG